MERFLTDAQIGEKIKEARLAKGWTQADLAARIGVGQTAVGKWEKGVVTNIKRTMIQKIGETLDINPLFIVGIVPEGQQPTTITIKRSDVPNSIFVDIEKLLKCSNKASDYVLLVGDDFKPDDFEQIKKFVAFIKAAK